MDSRSSNTTPAPDVNTNTELPLFHSRGSTQRSHSTTCNLEHDCSAEAQICPDKLESFRLLLVSMNEQRQSSQPSTFAIVCKHLGELGGFGSFILAAVAMAMYFYKK